MSFLELSIALFFFQSLSVTATKIREYSNQTEPCLVGYTNIWQTQKWTEGIVTKSVFREKITAPRACIDPTSTKTIQCQAVVSKSALVASEAEYNLQDGGDHIQNLLDCNTSLSHPPQKNSQLHAESSTIRHSSAGSTLQKN